jgi:hypothetical protein
VHHDTVVVAVIAKLAIVVSPRHPVVAAAGASVLSETDTEPGQKPAGAPSVALST